MKSTDGKDLNICRSELTPIGGPVTLRLGKSTKTGIGKRRDPSKPIKAMKSVSKKQRARTSIIHENFERVCQEQEKLYGERFCQAGAGEWENKCPNNKPGRRYPLVPDHVLTRNQENADRHENLQPLCTWCNFYKGSRRIDFRPPEFVEACKALDS